MTEREVLQAAMRNCNPRLASILRGTVNTFDDLIRVRALVERDIMEEKAYWRQRNAEQTTRKGGSDKQGKGKEGNHNIAMLSECNIKLLTVPVELQKHLCDAIIDTGISYSLNQESVWKKWKSDGETWESSEGYWQVRMDDCSIQKTKNNQYEFVRLPFGLKNAGATFQRMMNRILKNLIVVNVYKVTFTIVVYSKDVQQHVKDLNSVFYSFKVGGLTLNLKKCNLCKTSLTIWDM